MQVAEALPPTVTGADISAATSGAYFRALERKIAELRAEAQLAINGTGKCDTTQEHTLAKSFQSFLSKEITKVL